MKMLSPKLHGMIDFIAVIIFGLAPMAFGFRGIPAKISYLLAGVHLVMTLATAFPCGLFKIIPMRIHSIVEFVVSITLVILPWILGFSSEYAARNFYIGMGIIIFVVGLLTSHQTSDRKYQP